MRSINVRVRIVPKGITSHLEKQFPAKAARPFHDIFRRLANEVAEAARGQVPVATGSLRDSIQVVQERETGSPYKARWAVQAAGDERRYRFNRRGRLYGLYVHTGGKAHYPPIRPIMAWVEVVRPDLRRNPEELRSMAYHVATAIAMRGTPRVPFLTDPFANKVLDTQMAWQSELLESMIRAMKP